MRRMSNFESAALAQTRPNVRPLVADVLAPAVTVSRQFDVQSYFSSTLLEAAILTQPTNSPIVDSDEAVIPGYSLGLHPSSQTPIAIEFRVGAQPGSSGTIILRPGQIIRPFGKPDGSRASSFSGFRWGLPFGWLGGGVATVCVFPSPDAHVSWPGDSPEILFHRTRMKIIAPASLPAAAPLNWPMRFPWAEAVEGVNDVPQGGEPTLAVTPTRVLMRLRLGSLAAASDMRLLMQGGDDFDVHQSTVTSTPVSFVDITWGTYAANGGAGDLGTNYSVRELPQEFVRLAANAGGIQLVDMSGGTLATQYVDVVRYGRL